MQTGLKPLYTHTHARAHAHCPARLTLKPCIRSRARVRLAEEGLKILRWTHVCSQQVAAVFMQEPRERSSPAGHRVSRVRTGPGRSGSVRPRAAELQQVLHDLLGWSESFLQPQNTSRTPSQKIRELFLDFQTRRSQSEPLGPPPPPELWAGPESQQDQERTNCSSEPDLSSDSFGLK